jgi:hypothetical protein
MHTHQKGGLNIVCAPPIKTDPKLADVERQTANARLYAKAMLTGPHSRMLSIWLLILLFSSMLSYVAVAASPGSGSGLLPLVTVAPVAIQDVNPPTEYIGHVEAI